MNKKMITILLLAASVILVAAPESFATSQYFAALNTVYPGGSCGTCHVNSSNDGPRTPYGLLFEKQTNHNTNASAALRAIGAPPPANLTTPAVTLTPAATLTATPEVTTVTETPEVETTEVETTEDTTMTETAEETPAIPAATTKSPGFGVVVSMIGLIAWALLGRRKN
jgi:PGF-CTERM protein